MHPADVSDAVAGRARRAAVSAMALHAQLELAAWLRARTPATIYFDPQEDYIAGHEAALLDAVRACDVFLPSEIEAARPRRHRRSARGRRDLPASWGHRRW